MPVGHIYVHVGSEGRAPRGAAVGTREWLPVGREEVRGGGEGRAPRDAAVVAREWLPVGRTHVRVRGAEGHFEILKWLRANGFPLDADT